MKLLYKNSLGEKFYTYKHKPATTIFFYEYNGDEWIMREIIPIEGEPLVWKASVKYLFTETAANPASALVLYSEYLKRYKYKIKQAIIDL